MGQGFLPKIWILAWAIIPILFVGSQSVSIEVRIIWYQSTGSKISFLSILSFVSCYHPILFLLCSLFFVLILWRALVQNRAPSSKKKKGLQKRNRKQKKNIFRSFNSLKSKYYFLLSSSFDLVFLSYFLAISISLNTTSLISWSSLLV